MTATPLPPNDPTRASMPTAEDERIGAIDVLRGFALLGILVMNIQSFAMIDAAYMNPTAMGPLVGGDHWVWLYSHVLADQKFMTIFSILFGAGIVLMAGRTEAKGRSAAAIHYQRMGWLLVIGLMHAYLLWHGDILVTYALCGLVVFLFRKLSPRTLLVLGILSIGVASLLSLGMGYSVPHWPEGELEYLEEDMWAPSAEAAKEQIAVYQGSWLTQMPHRAESSLAMQTFAFLIFFSWRAGGLMLVGMAFYRWDILTGRRSVRFYATLAIVCACLGFPLIARGVQQNFAAGWDIRHGFFFGMQYNYWGSLLISTAYIGLVMLACKVRPHARVLRPLAAVGQMALTNYLAQTILCTTLFYGHGLGQFGQFSRVEQLLTVVVIWTIQLVLSPLWLRRFRFGPAEWLWRSLSYRRRQPMRRR